MFVDYRLLPNSQVINSIAVSSELQNYYLASDSNTIDCLIDKEVEHNHIIKAGLN